MTFKPALVLLTLTLLSPLVAQEMSLAQKGKEAMASRLWELAAIHLGELLVSPDLDPDQRPEVAVRLCESWIRDGKPAEALKLLEQSFVQAHPESRFWTGQSLAAMGRFADAVEALEPVVRDPQSANRDEAGFTVASLQLALGKPEAALKTLSELTRSANPDTLTLARMRQAFILLDLERTEEAGEILPDVTSLPAKQQALARYLNANILLRSGSFEEATAAFQLLVDDPSKLSMRRFHAAIIGLADAMSSQGKTAASADLLLNFIQQHPDSPQLEEIFKRILTALPEKPIPSDPILERLAEWIAPPEIPTTGLIPTRESHAVSAWPTDSNPSDLLAFALFTRAAGLQRAASDDSRAEAMRLLTRLHFENPRHFLATRALLMMARWKLESGKVDDARHILQTLRASATSPVIKGKAAFIEALSNADNAPEEAAGLFNEAAELLSGMRADTARFNAALVQLTEPDDGTTPVVPVSDISDRSMAATLELERALARSNPNEKRAAIDEFLIDHPEHPRAAEARLTVANAALSSTPPDLSFAVAQVETIEADDAMKSAVSAAEMALLKLRIDDLAGETEKTITTARTLIADFPSSSQAEEAAFILGRNLFASGNYNDARIVLQSLASSVTRPDRKQVAWLLAARAAALVPTSQSQQEALGLFDQAIATEGPVTPLAKLEKARLMIDMSQLDNASRFLREWFDALPEQDPLHTPVGFLLAEAIYAQGSQNPESLPQAMEVYDRLAAGTEKFSPTDDRLQYLRGRTLEQLPDPENPTLQRDKQAFIAYYSVLERTTPPEQWHFFELCGFQALSLLEKARRWPAAIACAKKIASFKGPRAEEAAARANQLQLKHMIWED